MLKTPNQKYEKGSEHMLKVKTMKIQTQEEMLGLLSFKADAERVRGFQFSGVITCAHMGFLVMQLLSG